MSVRLSDLELEQMLGLFVKHRLKKENVSDSLRLLLGKMQFLGVGVVWSGEERVLTLAVKRLECALRHEYESWDEMIADDDFIPPPEVHILLRSKE